MKILLVTPIRNTPQDPHYFWLKALRQLKHRMVLFPLKRPGRLINSWCLFRTINRFKPDEVFFSAGRDAVYPVKGTIFFCGVPPAWLSRTERITGKLAKLVVVNDDRHRRLWQSLGVKKVLNLPISGVDQQEFKPKKLKRIFPVSFVGSLFPDRQRQLLKIVKLYPDLKIWGALPPRASLLPKLKVSYQGEGWGEKLTKIYQQSLISLNLAPDHMSQGGNIRTFEIAAAGALLLTDQLNPDWFGQNKEAVKFGSAEDCTQKISYYLAHRQKLAQIARAGRKRTIRQHAYLYRFRRLLQQL